jgi:hypothetical protein
VNQREDEAVSIQRLAAFFCLAFIVSAARADDKKDEAKKAVTGTLKMGEHTFKLENAVAFETKRSDKIHTAVILSEQPPDLEKLKASLKKKGTDGDYFFFKPHVKLIFDEKGKLDFVFIYAEGASINSGGNKNMTGEATVKDGALVGKSSMTKPEKFFDMSYTYDAKFDVKIMKPD